MKNAFSVVSSRVVLLLVGAMLLAGCRTYGSYDSTEKMLPEVAQSTQLLASQLERARSARSLLAQAARDDSTLRIVAEEYEKAVALHEEALENSREVLTRFEDDLPDYRTMHRTFGALLSEQQVVRNRYRSLTKAVRYPGVTMRMDPTGRATRSMRASAIPDSLPRARGEAYTEGRYYVAPIFYERLQNTGDGLTMRQALAERRQRESQQGRLSMAPGEEAPAAPAADSSGRVSQ